MPTKDMRLPHRGAGRVLRLGLALALFSAICAVAMTSFNLGFTHGTAAGAVGVVIYSVPATLFDWPRITFSDVIDLLSAAVSAVVEFFESLFDW